MNCAALARLVVSKGPDRFAEFPSFGGPPCLDTNAASRLDGAPELRFLRANGYVRGFERTWLDGSRTDVVDVLVAQFRTGAGALAYADRAFSAALRQQPRPVRLAVPGVPNASGLTATSQAATAALIVEHVGPFAVVISCSDTSKDRAVERAVQYAQDQYRQL
jgi:hypothetical protein